MTRRTLIPVAAVFTLVVFVPTLSYLGGLGLYSDDWAFFADLAASENQTVAGLTSSLFHHTIARPTQGLYLSVLFALFGTSPLGYHVVNHAVLSLTLIAFYICLSMLRVPLVVAIGWPLVYAVLPHYSTDRLWIATMHGPLSSLLYFVSLYAGLKATVSGRPWRWRGLSLVAMLFSLLAYEVIAPFFLINPLLENIAWRARNHTSATGRLRPSLIRSYVLTFCMVAIAVTYKSAVSPRIGIDLPFGAHLSHLFTGILRIHFLELGIGLPAKAYVALTTYASRADLFGAALVGVLAFVACNVSLRSQRVAWKEWVRWGGAGVLMIFTGYAVFLVTSHVGFVVAGLNDRTAIVAAIGAALVLVSILGLLTSMIRSPVRQNTCLALGVGILCTMCQLINSVVADFWLEAARHQTIAVESLKGSLPTLRGKTTVLIDRLCRYVGPGIVFETNWDTSGMLRMQYGDDTLRGDVLSDRVSIEESGISIQMYSDTNHYPYRDDLLVFDAVTRRARPLRNHTDALEYFRGVTARTPDECRGGYEGIGIPIF